MKKLLVLVTVLMTGFAVMACDIAGDDRVELGYVNWAEGVAMNYVIEAILEDEMGYDVTSRMADVGPIFQSLANGNTDAFVDAWLPVTHQNYIEEYGDDIADLGYNFEGARIGLVVPDYVYAEVQSIADLNDFVEQFDGRIIGIDAGAGIMSAADAAIAESGYDLDFELLTGTDPLMVIELQQAINAGEWIVVTGWEPHYKFADFDLEFLEDPEGIFGDVEAIHTVARNDLADDMPDVAQLLENFYLTSEQMAGLMAMFQEHGEDLSEAEIARLWTAENDDLVQSWLP